MNKNAFNKLWFILKILESLLLICCVIYGFKLLDIIDTDNIYNKINNLVIGFIICIILEFITKIIDKKY